MTQAHLFYSPLPLEDFPIKWLLLTGIFLVLVWFLRRLFYHDACGERPLRMVRASTFSPETLDQSTVWDVVMIGTGPGACTCANLLARMGRKVLMLEQHETATGGGTHSFRYEGCEWDTGLHYTSAAMSQATSRPGAIMDFMTNGTQKFHCLPEPYDEVFFPDNKSYPFMNGKARTLDAIFDTLVADGLHDDEVTTSDTKQIEELKHRTKTFLDLYSDVHQGFVALGLSRILPRWLTRFMGIPAKVEELMTFATMTVRDVLYAVIHLGYNKELLLHHACPHAPKPSSPRAHFVDDEQSVHMLRMRQRLEAILAHPIGDYGTQPRMASFAAHGVTAEHYIDGGSYTVGPTQNISIRLTSVVRDLGGQVFVDATVREIIVEGNKAVGVRVSKTSDLRKLGADRAPETVIRAKRVICGTSVYNLYNKLLRQDMEIVQQFHDPNERTMRQSNGHLFVFCKLKGTPEELEIPGHNIWYFHGDDLDTAFDSFYRDPYHNRPPVVYIGFPCTKDTTWSRRFPGTSNCIVISDGLYDWFEQWSQLPVRERGDIYDKLKQHLTMSLADILFERFPQLKDKVEVVHFATPVSEESFLGCYRGGAYDTLCTPAQFAPINQKWITTPRTPIKNLFVASSSAFFPGLTGSLYAGCICCCSVIGTMETLWLGHMLLRHMAARLREENPKLTWIQSYRLAYQSFTG